MNRTNIMRKERKEISVPMLTLYSFSKADIFQMNCLVYFPMSLGLCVLLFFVHTFRLAFNFALLFTFAAFSEL